jgi:hypothetical protein
MKKIRITWGHCLRLLAALAVLALNLPTTALAAAPPNDYFASATPIAGLPFASDPADISLATTEFGEPQPCNFSPRTVWYSFTPAVNTVVSVDMVGSSFSDTILRVYQAISPGIFGLSLVPNGCASFGGSVSFTAQAGTTYYFQAGSVFSAFGTARVNLQGPPSNDNFADAKPIAGPGFSEAVNTASATRESGEPTPSCASSVSGGTMWYAFTPSVSGSVSGPASASGPFSPVLAAYTGSSVTSLTEVGCRSFTGLLTFRANAGTTYYFQVGSFGTGGPLQFRLDVAPAPTANYFFSPFDPSVFDAVQFIDTSYDPGQAGVDKRTWDFGDGATVAVASPTNRYAADGDYTVSLSITTFDGRTASTSQTVKVKSHDVAITKLAAPQAASAGQTRQLSVGVNSKRYDETVEVRLYKSVPSGYQLIGTLAQTVPVRSANRTTDFAFSYTLIGDDATIGKVTFKAVATIVGARDALPADNEAISSPTKVSR